MDSNKDGGRLCQPALSVALARGAAATPVHAMQPASMAELSAEPGRCSPVRGRLHAREWLWLLGRLFPPGLAIDAVTSAASFDVAPEDVWKKMVFYEEVPQRPPLLLRIFLPIPMKTQASGKRVGATAQCSYSRGSLVKRFTVLEPPHTLRFEVIEQNLGLERCVRAVEGSYEIRAAGRGSEVALTTKYRGHLRPRWLWRRLERLLAHQLHRHILAGMGANRARLVNTASTSIC